MGIERKIGAGQLLTHEGNKTQLQAWELRGWTARGGLPTGTLRKRLPWGHSVEKKKKEMQRVKQRH